MNDCAPLNLFLLVVVGVLGVGSTSLRTSATRDEIMFTCSPPKEIVVAEFATARICCEHNGTHDDPPLLRINSTLYHATDLPYGYYYTRKEGFHVKATISPMNGTTYSCLHIDYDSSGKQFTIESCKATLVVMDVIAEKAFEECRCDPEHVCEPAEPPAIYSASQSRATVCIITILQSTIFSVYYILMFY